MNLELDHVFILVKSEARVADLLIAKGFEEGTRNIHPGQGTSNRRFFFSDGMLEFIWVRDVAEAKNGTGRDLLLTERDTNSTASPFGVILRRKDRIDSPPPKMPFNGWSYQPTNIMNWLTLKIFFYLLIFYLIADVINSLNERSPENSASIIDRITLIAEIDPNTIYQIEQEARQERIERFEEQQQLLTFK